MTTVAEPVRETTQICVRLAATRGGEGEARLGRLTGLLREAGIGLVRADTHDGDAVLVAAAATVEDALAAVPAPADARRMLAVCDSVSPAGLGRAIRAGVPAVLLADDVTPAQLSAAVHGAHHGDGRVPYTALVRLLGGAGTHPGNPGTGHGPAPGTSPLTARQTSVLALMAEGHRNAAIARALSCSEHTVKNVIYELMGRLHARSRAQAVAHAVRSGLV
ncbi:hypothetical protein GCM10009716_42610 [Streptomyces sodiiphilus]|uniref:HTH luxR-type domain-containing protein n=1 Tax=Streptomyces sodiiphilus TaxID=226217 RepID=A0ABN2PS32_9ACTN